ncbi:hypothetical protein V5799_016412 [Amblyomma americanum]|uniref:Uncharacterized protein n=1 Tax=Amblyomma americanum TaxID=6943 RepID=A0AAQ4E2N7_AMBAM
MRVVLVNCSAYDVKRSEVTEPLEKGLTWCFSTTSTPRLNEKPRSPLSAVASLPLLRWASEVFSGQP